MRYTLNDGAVIEAGVKLGEGGEGAVFGTSDPDRAIKLYHKPLSGQAADKLRAMVGLNTGELAAQAAWPQALITAPGGAIAGFVMQKALEPFDIHAVYSPRDRRDNLPRADWGFLVQVAANLAAAFHAAHEAGVVIGDVNHGSVRVGRDGCVRLIDCDSYQIRKDGQTLRCGVGVDAYTPPELQGVPLSDVDRTPDHDAFGLAVLIFQLLFMGRHPFAGAPRIAGAPTDIPSAIAARAYAYAADGALLRPPPSAPPIDLVSPDLALMFEQAFGGQGPRPSPLAWHRSLMAFLPSLAACSASPRHRVPSHMKACPWCAFDKAGVEFFPTSLQSGGAIDFSRFDASLFQTLWNRIDIAEARMTKIRAAAGDYTVGRSGLHVLIEHKLNQARTAHGPPRLSCRIISWTRRSFNLIAYSLIICAIPSPGIDPFRLCLAGVGGIGLLSLCRALIIGPERRFKAAHEELRRLCMLRTRDLDSIADANGLRQEIRQRRDEGRRLLAQVRTFQHLSQDAPREAQLRAFLMRFPIRADSVAGIGQSRIAQLASFGIDSAGAIERDAIRAVPGFGPQLAERLCQWRDALAAQFRFNPDLPIRLPDKRRSQREARTALAYLESHIAQYTRDARKLERRLAQVEARLSAGQGAIDAAISALAAAQISYHAARL